MSIRKDLQEIRQLVSDQQHLEYERETKGTNEELELKLKEVNSKLLCHFFKERYVKIGSIISAYAKANEIGVGEVQIKSKMLHNPGKIGKDAVIRLIRDAGDYHKISVEISGGKKIVRFKFALDVNQVLEDGTRASKHIKVNKNGEVWVNPQALAMFEASDILENTIRVIPYQKTESGLFVEESCGKIAPAHLFGKVFVNALLAEEKKNSKSGEKDGEERE